MQADFSDNWILKFLIVLTTTSLFGGAFAGIVTLTIIRKSNFIIEIFRLLIGAIGGCEGFLVIPDIYYLKDNNLNEILEVIISNNQSFLREYPQILTIILSIFGAIGASVAIFMMKKVFRWRS